MRILKRLLILGACCLPVVAVANTDTSQGLSPKRGLAYGHPSAADLALIKGHIAWWYNWAVTPTPDTAESDIEYVPMVWGCHFDEKRLRQYLSSHPKVKYLLGFNEPNFKHQANISPQKAAENWRKLQAIADEFHLKTVAPAVNFSPDRMAIAGKGKTGDPFDYLDAFFKACQGCRIDYVAVHSYMDSPRAFKRYVSRFYQRYHKPVWVTEWDYQSRHHKATLNQQLDYLAETVHWLEHQPFVYRYAWFVGRSKHGANKAPFIDLLGAPGQWSLLGKLYGDIPATNVYLPVPGVINGDQAVASQGVHYRPMPGANAQIALQAGEGSHFGYQLETAKAGGYVMTLRYASSSASELQLKVGQQPWRRYHLASTGAETWQQLAIPVTLQAGRQHLKLAVKSGEISVDALRFTTP
ncbi:glycosyl hydrolase [Gallaecimonas mangrovi]|uniref:glycosyl hydrolase n=1 Tax=Gallaecimonas mangrovi TaxID=2291597 RepID=UPI0018663A1B|nr:glycosyl hydrolase [Gallaecimonas mangrovi]